MRSIILLSALFSLAACAESTPSQTADTPVEPPTMTMDEPTLKDISTSLESVLAAQPEAVQARYPFRNPAQTLDFFGIESGMTVVEALPGGGWYSKILLPYLGEEGELIGANYSIDMQRLFSFRTPEQLKKLETWTTDWPETAATWVEGNNTPISGFFFGAQPESMAGSADAVLLSAPYITSRAFKTRATF